MSVGSVVAELCCYVTVFLHLYTHNNGLAMRKLLPANEINRRNQKNAVTLLGQFYGFGFEIIFYFWLLISLKSKDSFGNWNKLFEVVLVTGFWIEFGLLSIVEVMTSKSLKENLPHNRFRRWYCIANESYYCVLYTYPVSLYYKARVYRSILTEIESDLKIFINCFIEMQ